MRNLTVALFAGLGVIASATGAFAGETSVFNKYSHTNTYDGYTETNVDAHIYSETNTITDSLSIKSESYGGDVNDNH
jgi:hypothetical protein